MYENIASPRASLSNLQICVLACLFGILVPHSLINKGVPDDSSVYAYIGWAMLKGKMPYIDVWDHKGPLLYLFQYLGAAISREPGRGVRLLDLLSSIISVALMFWVVCRMIAIRATLVLMLGSLFFCTFYCSGGNMTETWAVLFLAMSHFAAWRAAKNDRAWFLGALSGAASAAIFWIRPNMMVFAALGTLYIIYRCYKTGGIRSAGVQLSTTLGCALLVTAISLAPYARAGALPAMRSAYFAYNVAYSHMATNVERLDAFRSFRLDLFQVAIAVAAFWGWLACLYSLLSNNKSWDLPIPRDYQFLLVAAAPIEFLTVVMSGRAYDHYLFTLWPTFLLLATLAVTACSRRTTSMDADRQKVPNYRLIWLLLLIALPSELQRYTSVIRMDRKPSKDTLAVAALVGRITSPSDRIAILGGPVAADVYLRSQRFATSRYFYTLPISHAAFARASQTREEYVQQIEENPPKLIASGPQVYVGPLCETLSECAELSPTSADSRGYQAGALPLLLQPLIAATYVRIEDASFGQWRVYVRRDVAKLQGLSQVVPK